VSVDQYRSSLVGGDEVKLFKITLAIAEDEDLANAMYDSIQGQMDDETDIEDHGWALSLAEVEIDD
jgi:hypothetical protein